LKTIYFKNLAPSLLPSPLSAGPQLEEMGQDTFRPRGARTKLEVDQEFKGRLGEYLEERPFEGY